MVAKVHPLDVQKTEKDSDETIIQGVNTGEINQERKSSLANTKSVSPEPDPDVYFSYDIPPEVHDSHYSKHKGISKMNGLDYLQIRQTNRDMEDFANVQNIYDVEKRSKDKLFYGMECTQPDVRAKVQSSTNSSQPFALKLMDTDGRSEILEIDRRGLNEVPSMVYQLYNQQREPMGLIQLQYGWRQLAPTFIIVDKEDRLLMKIVGPTPAAQGMGSKETKFAVYIVDADGDANTNTTSVGSIVMDGDIFAVKKKKKASSNLEEVIKINYVDKELDELCRAMILSTAFILDYTKFKKPNPFMKLASLICCKCI